MSASSVVGQELGNNDTKGTIGYARNTTTFSGFVYAVAEIATFVATHWIARLFVTNPPALVQTATFVRIMSGSFVGLALLRSFGGILNAAGDNR